MAESESTSAAQDGGQITFLVKSSNDTKYPVSILETATIRELKEKLAGSDYADTPVERQRLIFSGRVLKDSDTIASAKIKEGHTVHLVKSAASNVRQNPAASASSSGSPAPAANVPTNMAAGTGNNPLAGLTGARYAGFHGLPSLESLGGDGMGAGLDPDRFERMLDDPNFIQQMNEMMDNPMVQQMILDSPQMRDNPIARQMIQNRDLRRMMFNPDFMRAQMRMQQQMNRDRDRNNFPAPGQTDNTGAGEGEGQQGQPNQTSNNSSPPPNPFLMGMPTLGQAGANPFASLFGTMPPSQPPSGGNGTNTTTTGDSTSNTTSTAESNPMQDYLRTMMGPRTASPNNDQLAAMTRLMQNPDFLQLAGSMYGTNPPNLADLGAFGAGGTAGAGGAGGAGGTGTAGDFANPFFPFGQMPTAPQSPPDTRPPEERYAEQLGQLNDMGFFDFDRNVEALRRTGGSVQGAVEYLLSHPS